jgi:BirA family transcriptional regulator, biotin operon repressor / biotin---[acetyl-CoA-carboxylase] ligase
VDAGGREVAVLTRIVTVAETGSTNADLLALARDGAEEGVWLRADRQTAGRGREGRTWQSAAGNLYASTLVRLRPGDPPAPTLALVAAVALAETIRMLGVAVTLKWPNDLLVEGAKLSGILLERGDDAVVIGIGVNLASAPAVEGRAVASLAGRVPPLSAAQFLEHLAEQVAAWLEHWRRDLATVTRRWSELAHAPGTPLVVRLPDGEQVAGRFDALGADGALILRLADGSARAIHAGDVFLV